jgi:fructuronate reductase
MRLGPETAALPYDRGQVTPGIVHLGVGAFFRAHAAVYVDDLLVRDPTWGVIGVSLRRPDMRNALLPQGFCYTVAVKGAEGTQNRVVGALLDILDLKTQLVEILAALCDPRVRIVTMTVTEKGYCLDPATSLIDPHHPDIRHDVHRPDAPRSAPGLILRALEQRRAVGVPPFTVLCCDNLPANGRTTAEVVAGLAALREPALGRFVLDEVHFPSTMVDRIVPATTDADREAVRDSTGFEDAWPVVTEPFTQWVIEDDFPQGRPDFATAGATMTQDVHAFELMKLRMLNGSHSTLAYLGYLAGFESISDTVANPDFAGLARDMMAHEIIGTLGPDLGDLNAYADQLMQRFANPALKHRTWQIAMDGSQKLPHRLLGTIRDRLAKGQGIDRLALGVAAWMRYVTGIDEAGKPIDVKDPLADSLAAISNEAGRDPKALVKLCLGLTEVFGSDLRNEAQLCRLLEQYVGQLWNGGAAKTVRRIRALQTSQF